MELWMIVFGVQFVLLAGAQSIQNNPTEMTNIVIIFGIVIQSVGLYNLNNTIQKL